MSAQTYGGRLLPQHQELLARSAIDPEVAAERGYVSVDRVVELERRGFARYQRSVPGLLIPLWSTQGELAGYQYRPDHSRVDADGRVVKYESPGGQRMVLDVPRRCRGALGDPGVELWVTEGARKADALVSAGAQAVVSLLGVWCWRGTNSAGGKTALADWENVALNDGRRVLLAFDSDAWVKPEVHDALARLRAFLAARGASVWVVPLPPLDDGKKAGVDDLLGAGWDLERLAALATEDLPPRPRPEVDELADVPDEEGWRVLDDVEELLRRHVVLPDEHAYRAVTLWAAHTHAIEAFDFTPRFVFTSPDRRCGKSRALELVERLSRRPRYLVDLSTSYLFRSVEQTRPTLLVDEADTIFGGRSEKAEELRGLINAGFRRGATVGRMVGEGAAMTPQEFDVFCPVALAGIGDYAPDTVTDRAVVVEMRRRLPGETVEPLRARKIGAQTEPLRRRLAAWATRRTEALADAEPEMPDGVTDRAADAWEPLLAIADAAGGRWPEIARQACRAFVTRAAEGDAESRRTRLLADIRAIFAEARVDRLSSADLVERLNALEEAPWATSRGGRGLTTDALAKMLRPFGVRSQTVRTGGTTAKGYLIADFADAFARYLPTDDEDARADTPAKQASQTSQRHTGAGDGLSPAVLPDGDVTFARSPNVTSVVASVTETSHPPAPLPGLSQGCDVVTPVTPPTGPVARAHTPDGELVDLPIGELGTCRACGATTATTDATGPICRRCARRWREAI